MKIVCDSDKINSAVDSTKNILSDVNSEYTSYQTSFENSLSDWAGTSKESCINLISQESNSIKNMIDIDNNFLDYLKTFVAELESLEDELSSIKI